jgi:type I restriction enzyme R subunit
VRVQLQALNKVQFTDSEWLRFVETSLDRPGSQLEITRSISRRERRSQSPLEI